MSPPKKGGGGKKAPKKPVKKPSSFAEFWNRLLRKDKKKAVDGVPTQKTVQRAVDKVAKNLHLKKKERQQVASVLAAEMQQRALEQKQPQQRKAVAEGVESYPVPIQTGLFEQQPAEAEAAPEAEPAVVALEQPLPKRGVSDLEMQRKSFLERAGASGTGASLSGKGGKQAYSPEAYGSQPTSITLDNTAVKEIKQHMLISMLQDVLVNASIRSVPNQKRPEDMNPEELVQLRKTNVREWNALVRENTVVSFALSKARQDDLATAKKIKEKAPAKRKPLKFDDTVEVANAPVGQDFNPDEKKSTTSGSLKRT